MRKKLIDLEKITEGTEGIVRRTLLHVDKMKSFLLSGRNMSDSVLTRGGHVDGEKRFDLGSHVYMTYSNYENEGTLDLCQYCYIDGKGHLKYFVTQGFS